jgi:hypothetical protein
MKYILFSGRVEALFARAPNYPIFCWVRDRRVVLFLSLSWLGWVHDKLETSLLPVGDSFSFFPFKSCILNLAVRSTDPASQLLSRI